MLRFEMTISMDEFLRLLPGAVGPFLEEAGAYVHREAGRAWTLTVAPMPPLALGAIRLERIAVGIFFEGYAEADRQVFLDRFRRATQKGGG